MTAKRISLAVLTFVHGACASGVVAKGDPVTYARAQLQRMVREQELAGAQYIAVSADRTLVDVSVGTADVATGERMRADTLQMAYSLTKVVTAVAVMQLVDAGRLSLDTRLSDLWPMHPYGATVTVRSLLAHTSGVPNPAPLDWFVIEGEPLDRQAALRRVLDANPKRDDAVGETYRYTNIGYWLLEKVIEAASGQDYARYLEEHVFAPLTVSRDMFTFDLDQPHAFATGHSRRFTAMNLALYLMTPGRYWGEPHRDWSRTTRVQPIGRAYGGLYCSASALAPLLQDLLRPQPQLMSRQARDQMFEVQHTDDGKPIEGTLGWVTGQLNGVRYFGKQGGGLGFHGNVRIYPDLGVATVLLSNRTEVSAGAIDARSDEIDAAFAAASRD